MKKAICLVSFCALSTMVARLYWPSVFGGERGSECLESRPQELCTVDLETHEFAKPNLLVPEDIRGVYWIDAGHEGYTNPWVDLNYLTPFPKGSSKEGHFWVKDSTPKYQSWEDIDQSVSYVKRLKMIGSRSQVAPDLTVTWSACFFTCGTSWETWVPLPLSSPSEKIGENEYIRKAALFGKEMSSWKGYRIIDHNGERTEFFEKMVKTMKDGRAMMLPDREFEDRNGKFTEFYEKIVKTMKDGRDRLLPGSSDKESEDRKGKHTVFFEKIVKTMKDGRDRLLPGSSDKPPSEPSKKLWVL